MGCDVIIAHLIAESKVKVDLMQPVQIAIPMYLTSVVPGAFPFPGKVNPETHTRIVLQSWIRG